MIYSHSQLFSVYGAVAAENKSRLSFYDGLGSIYQVRISQLVRSTTFKLGRSNHVLLPTAETSLCVEPGLISSVVSDFSTSSAASSGEKFG